MEEYKKFIKDCRVTFIVYVNFFVWTTACSKIGAKYYAIDQVAESSGQTSIQALEMKCRYCNREYICCNRNRHKDIFKCNKCLNAIFDCKQCIIHISNCQECIEAVVDRLNGPIQGVSSNNNSKKSNDEHIEYVAHHCSIEKFNNIIDDSVSMIESGNIEQEEATILFLLDILLKLLKSSPLSSPLSPLECSDHSSEVTLPRIEILLNKVTLSKIETLLNKLANSIAGLQPDSSKKLRLFINNYIISNFHFNQALLSAVQYAHVIDIIDKFLSGIVKVYGLEENPEMLYRFFSKGLDKGHTMLYRAVLRNSSDSIEMIMCLAKHCFGNLNHLASNGKDLLRNIRSHFLDELVEYKPGKYQTALHLAVINCNLSQVQCLLNLGADLNIKDSAEKTTLYLAIQYAHPTIVRYLLEQGANLHLTNSQGTVALSIDMMVNRALKLAKDLSYSKDKLIKTMRTPIKELAELLQKLLDRWRSLIYNSEEINFFLDSYLKPALLESQHLLHSSSASCIQIISWLELCRDAIIYERQGMFHGPRRCDSTRACDSSRTTLSTLSDSSTGQFLYGPSLMPITTIP